MNGEKQSPNDWTVNAKGWKTKKKDSINLKIWIIKQYSSAGSKCMSKKKWLDKEWKRKYTVCSWEDSIYMS